MCNTARLGDFWMCATRATAHADVTSRRAARHVIRTSRRGKKGFHSRRSDPCVRRGEPSRKCWQCRSPRRPRAPENKSAKTRFSYRFCELYGTRLGRSWRKTPFTPRRNVFGDSSEPFFPRRSNRTFYCWQKKKEKKKISVVPALTTGKITFRQVQHKVTGLKRFHNKKKQNNKISVPSLPDKQQ